MATLFKSAQSQLARPPVTLSQAGQIVCMRGWYSLLAALTLNDTIQLVKIPAGYVIDSFQADIDSLDSNAGPTLVPQFGILNAAGTALALNMLSISAANAKIGGLFTPSAVEYTRTGPKGYDRYLGMLVQTGPATGTTRAGGLLVNKGKWQPGTAYIVGDYIEFGTGLLLKCTTAGTSAAVEPDWQTTTTSDGSVVWTASQVLVAATVRMRAANYNG